MESARLTMVPVAVTDVARLVRHWNRPEVRRFLWDDKLVSAEVVAETVSASERDFVAAGYGLWMLWRITESLADTAFVGVCGLRTTGSGAPEILCSLEPEYWGQGYATEAAEVAIRDADVGSVLVASTDVGNVASERVLGRLGMVPDAEPDEHGLVHWRPPT